MAITRESVILLKLQNQVSNEMKKISADMKTEMAAIRSSVDQGTDSFDKHGKSIGKLSQWIREDRKEKRVHNYLFRESREVVGAAGLALSLWGQTAGQANEKSKKLTDSLNAGFVGFTGISSALFMLPGPAGIALGALGGLAIMFRSLTSDTEASKKMIELWKRQISDFNEGIGLDEARKEYDLLNAAIDDSIKRQKDFETQNKSLRGEAVRLANEGKATEATTSLNKVVSNLAEIESEKKRAAAFKLRSDGLRESIETEERLAELRERQAGQKEGDPLKLEKIDLHFSHIDKRMLKMQLGMTKITEVTVPKMSDSLKVTFGDAMSALGGFDEAMYQGFQAAGSAFVSGVGSAFESVFGEANSLLEIFLKATLEAFTQIAVQAAAMKFATGGFSGLLGWLGFHSGGTVPKAHSGAYINAPASHEFPILVRGGETIRTEQQEKNLRSRGGGSVSLTININAPGTPVEMVRRAIIDGLRDTGLTVDKYLVNRRDNLAF